MWLSLCCNGSPCLLIRISCLLIELNDMSPSPASTPRDRPLKGSAVGAPWFICPPPAEGHWVSQSQARWKTQKPSLGHLRSQGRQLAAAMDRGAEDPALEDSRCCHRKAGGREHGQGYHTSCQLGGLPWTPPQDLAFEVGIFRWPGVGPMALVPGSREEGVSGPLHLRQWETRPWPQQNVYSEGVPQNENRVWILVRWMLSSVSVYAYCFHGINSLK